MPEVQLYEEKGIVSTVSNSQTFTQKIEEMLELSSDKNLVQQRTEIAKKNSWDARYYQMQEILSTYL